VERRQHASLDAEQRRRRPEQIQPLTFENLTRPGPRFRETSGLVPLEVVQAGDTQVFAARGNKLSEPILDLDGLASVPSVESVVASTEIRARRPLPAIKELLLFGMTLVPDGETLGHLPNLERLWVPWAPINRRLEVARLPRGLRQLGVCRHVLAEPAAGRPRFSELLHCAGLEYLALIHCWPKDSVAPLGALTAIRTFRCDAPQGWSALRTCTRLEDVEAIRPRIANLRSLSSWTALRSLLLMNPGVRALDGIGSFTRLRRLHLKLLTVDGLEPLRGLDTLEALQISGLQRVRDLGPLADLRALRHLAVGRVGGEYRDIMHVASLRPLERLANLEELTLDGTIVDDGDLSPLVSLPRLARVRLFGDLEAGVEALRRARPDLEITWKAPQAPPGRKVGRIYLREPGAGLPHWWIREDLTDLLGVSTNAAAESRLRKALSANRALLARLTFDTEADAVTVMAPAEADLIEVAAAIDRLAVPSGGGA
jgi:hypothetical protein